VVVSLIYAHLALGLNYFMKQDVLIIAQFSFMPIIQLSNASHADLYASIA